MYRNVVSDPVRKLVVYFVCVLIAILAAGTYGVLHNQISYTVSPEYFTEFKFYQFDLADSSMPERVKASIVGVLASWWMGFPIGMLAGIAGFIQRDYRRMFSISLRGIAIAVLFTLGFGLCGLAYGFLETSSGHSSAYEYWYLPPNILDSRRFLCAGYMHNASYLGGVLAIPVSWAYQVYGRFFNPGPSLR